VKGDGLDMNWSSNTGNSL